MKSRLINVRLDEARLRKARSLRARGVVLSELIREAIDARFDAVAQATEPRDARQAIAALFERFPDPAGLEPRDYDVAAARAARAAIRRKLTRRRS